MIICAHLGQDSRGKCAALRKWTCLLCQTRRLKPEDDWVVFLTLTHRSALGVLVTLSHVADAMTDSVNCIDYLQ